MASGNTPSAEATRDQIADERDRAADLRELLAATRDRAADLRELLADGRVEIAEHEAASLRAALEARAVIQQAKGMVMLTLKIDADAAFDVLVRRSQDAQVKLVEVAREIVATGLQRG